jgi:hypothetical protein
MSNAIRHCRSCECQTLHRHLHDCEKSLGIHHIHGSERFECIRCQLPTFAHSEGAERFCFVLDGAERQSVSSHAGARR